MIKARKGFVPVLLALMTIFVFVPTMAFAQTGGTAVSWGEKYATVTDDTGHQFQTKRYFDGDDESSYYGSGLITADPQPDPSTIPPTPAPSSDGYFYDLDGSAFTYNQAPIDGKTMTQATFENYVLPSLQVSLVEPEYAEGYNPEAPGSAHFNINYDSSAEEATVSLKNWTLTIDSNMSEYKHGSEEDQTVTFSVKSIDPIHEVVPTDYRYPDLDGTVAEATVTVKGEPKTPETANFYFDSKDTLFPSHGGKVIGIYDGAAHTVMCDEVEGWTVSYQIYNQKTGKWGDALAVSVTDVDDVVKARAIFTNKETKAEKTRTFTAQLLSGLGVNIGWDEDASIVDEGYVYGVPSNHYIPAEYIVTEADQIKIDNSDSAAYKKYAKYFNECSKKAYEANKETVAAWFNDYYEVKETVKKVNSDEVKLQIQEKDLSEEEEEALAEKYARFLTNFGDDPRHAETYVGLDVDTDSEAYVELNYAALSDEVLFTEAPDMTYHVKKAKKLKKTKSFTVAAAATSGKVVSYKMDSSSKKITIDSATGKITVKKGIKKGTYKVKVIASTTKGDGYNAAGAVRYLQIKIKK